MADIVKGGRQHEELLKVIREVRSRWRTKMLLRGGVAIVAGALLALVLASYGLQTLRFSAPAITWFRIATLSAFAVLVLLWFVRPLRRRVSDMQVALYVEEYDPSLQAAILSAVEIGGGGPPGAQEIPAGHHRSTRRAGHREVPGTRRRQGRRPSGHPTVRDRVDERLRRHAPAAGRRSRIPAPGRLGASRALPQRGSRQPVRDRREPGRTRPCRRDPIS